MLIILSAPTKKQAHYWEGRLKNPPFPLLRPYTEIIGVVEQRPCGNGLGTLVAFREANFVYQQKQGKTLFQSLDEGETIALFHMAGKGSRLAPLSLAEYNNKPAVLLPAINPLDPNETPLSILEMVIKQADMIAPFHKGRLLVMWTDQLFLPSIPLKQPTSDIAIFAKEIPIPNEDMFKKQKLNQYGLIIDNKLINKVDYKTFSSFQGTHLFSSLGSFSLSPQILKQLLFEFDHEIKTCTSSYDTDPHFWMPMLWDKKTYLQLYPFLGGHFERMCCFKTSFEPMNIGKNGLYWDFGTCENYYRSLMKLLSPTTEGKSFRNFFGLTDHHLKDGSLIIKSDLNSCSVNHSILVHVNATHSQFHKTIAIKSDLSDIRAEESLLYQTKNSSFNYKKGSIQADLWHPSHLPLSSSLKNDPSLLWDNIIDNNTISFANQFALNNKL